MLAPLPRITDATRLAATGSLSHRIQLEGRRDEYRELADAFDAMLERLEAHVAEQQRFAANASHELRTPLAITQTLLDATRNDPNRDTDELVERLRAVNTRAIDLTEALLVLSRANQRVFTGERVDLSLIAEEATETLLPLAEKRGVTIETSGEITPTNGSRRCRPRPGNRREHHPGTRRNAYPHAPFRRRTACHGATPRREIGKRPRASACDQARQDDDRLRSLDDAAAPDLLDDRLELGDGAGTKVDEGIGVTGDGVGGDDGAVGLGEPGDVGRARLAAAVQLDEGLGHGPVGGGIDHDGEAANRAGRHERVDPSLDR